MNRHFKKAEGYGRACESYLVRVEWSVIVDKEDGELDGEEMRDTHAYKIANAGEESEMEELVDGSHSFSIVKVFCQESKKQGGRRTC